MISKIISIPYQGHAYSVHFQYRPGISNDTTVFIHGLGCVEKFYNSILKSKNIKSFSVLTVDLLGFGSSPAPTNFSYSLEAQAEIIKRLLKILKIQKINIVGHSMGGAVGLILAKKMFEQVRVYVSIEGNLISTDCGLMSRKTAKQSYSQFKNKGFDELKKILYESGDPGNRSWVRWSKTANTLAFYKTAKSLVRWSDSGQLLDLFNNPKITSWYFYGSKNKDLPVVKRIKDRAVTIQRSGHFMMFDNSREFYSKLSSKLR